jgi:hypothetical protein
MIEKKIFTGGLDTDTSDKLLQPGDYRYALNVRNGVTEDSDEGEITNVKGNVEIIYQLPAGNNITIGYYFDYGSNKGYYFNYNDAGNHHILEYDHTAQVVNLVLENTLLNFNENYLITGINVYQGLLYWTDNYNPPRKINIEKAKNILRRINFSDNYFLTGGKVGFLTSNIGGFQIGDSIKIVQDGVPTHIEYNVTTTITNISTASGQTLIETDINWLGSTPVNPGVIYFEESYTLPFLEEYIHVVKFPFTKSVDAEYISDGGYNQNNLRGTLYQFAVQYIFDDNEVSAMSPISTPPLPLADQQMYQNTDYPVSIQNGILIKVPTGSDIVTKINVMARKANTGDFQLIETVIKKDLKLINNSFYNYTFYNNSAPLPVSTSVQTQLYDKVPLLAKAQDIVNSNRLTYANILEDYNNVDINVEMIQARTGVLASKNPTIQVAESANTTPVSFHYSEIKYCIVANFSEGQTYTFSVYAGDLFSPKQIKFSYTTQSGDTELTVYNKLKDLINNYRQANPNNIFSPTQTINAKIGNMQPPYSFTQALCLEVDISWKQTMTGLSLNKPDAKPADSNSLEGYSISKIYPTLKKSSWFQYGIVYYDYANRSGSTNISPQSKIFIEYFPSDVLPTYARAIMRIKHLPPSWATHYQIVRTKNLSISRYLYVKAGNVTPVNNNSQITLSYITNFDTQYPDSRLSYTYTPGDRVRVIDPTLKGVWFDLEIVGQNTGSNYIEVKTNGVVINTNDLLELYTPEKVYDADKQLYYELGEVHPIVLDSSGVKVHGAIPSNVFVGVPIQDSTVPTSYTELLLNDWSDYIRTRGTDTQLIESSSFNDLYASDVDCIGRPNIVSNNIKQLRRPTTIYYSQPYVQDTEINGLSTFFDQNFETYDTRYNSIQRIFYKDNRLITFFENKVANIPVNQAIFSSTSGTTTVGLSDQILSNIPYWYEFEGGISLNPESFANFGNNIYFVDVRRGVVCRLAADGINPISEYQMHNYFTDKCASLMATGVVRILGAYDRRFNNYVVSFGAVLGQRLIYNPEQSVLDGQTGGLPVSYTVDIDTQNALYILDPTINFPTFRLLDQNPETIAFNEEKNRWISFYSYYPEFMGRAGTDIVTFKDGKIYLHNQTSLYNNYYGVSWPTELEVVSNESASNVKVWESVSLESTQPWEMYDAETPNNQKTIILLTDFENKENIYYAYMRNDINTPNVVDPIINGDVMRDVTLLAKFRNSSQSFVKIFAINFQYIISNLHNR